MRENDINQYKADIYSSINHNLKTPLNGIIPLVQICLESNNIILIKKNLDIIFSNSKMLVCMVQDIIDINKIRSKSLVINPHTF
jgi:K+-sensing histidine kinase KdpD